MVILPVAKVADVARAPQARRLSLIGLHRGVVQANGKKDQLAGLMLLFQSHLHFFLDPCAGDGMLRQDDHQLVVKADGRVNPGTGIRCFAHAEGCIKEATKVCTDLESPSTRSPDGPASVVPRAPALFRGQCPAWRGHSSIFQRSWGNCRRGRQS
jgi:hypothetical protein